MKKLALFFAGMLLGMFISLYDIRSERNRQLDLGPQIGHAATENQDDWDPCGGIAKMQQPLYPSRPRAHPLTRSDPSLSSVTPES